MGMVGHQPAKLLIDSGAAATLVHKRLLPEEGTQLRKTFKRVTGVTGADLRISGEADIDIEFNGLRITHNCLIVEDMENDVLVGYDFLTNGGYVLDFSRLPNEGPSQPKAKNYIALNQLTKQQTADLRLGAETYVPAYTCKYLLVKPARELERCLEARVRPVGIAEGVWVDDAVADIESNGKILVCLSNGTPEGVTLPRKTLLAKATSMPEERVNAISVQDWLDEPHNIITCQNINAGHTVSTERNDHATERGKRRSERILRLIDRTAMTTDQQRLVQRLVYQNPT